LQQQGFADSPADANRGGQLVAGEAFAVRNPGAAAPILLVGDHAGREIPDALAGLGLPEAARGAHIAWDIGVAGLGRALADRLGATFIAQRFSRLVIDCNRDPASEASIAPVSDGVAIPGNVGLTAEARAARHAQIFAPYHARIAAELDARAAPPLLVALHSFTPALAGGPARPWRFGVLHLGDSAASQRLLHSLRGRLDPALVGDNEPYRMDGTDYTVPRHAISRGLDYIELEVRQDLLATPVDQLAVAGFLAPSIRPGR
jgi:predicted N-formylglutamate amidohydrolase